MNEISATDVVDGLIAHYRQEHAAITEVADMIASRFSSVMRYFLEGNGGQLTRGLFEPAGAVAQLDADYWDRALRMTDVLDVMPQARRDEWHDMIRERKAPAFSEDTVRSTITDLLLSRSRFFAERVDGVFRALSREHVTNVPQGFGKRMIMYVRDAWGSDYKQCGHLDDLRCVIARIRRIEEPVHGSSSRIVESAYRHHGQWTEIDGGALRVRVYLKGTAHLEVHSDIAWQLNAVLAMLHPSAIPESFRTKPKRQRKVKDFELVNHMLPAQVIACLSNGESAVEARGERHNRYFQRVRNSVRLRHKDKHVERMAGDVLEALGAVRSGGYWQFDFDPTDVIAFVVASGRIPDSKTHQFYPTPESLAERVVAAADIEEHHTVLEPSAGLGALVRAIPSAALTCVEVSDTHCAVLRELGVTVEHADFLKWRGGLFDRIIMNPPFDQGRWQAHVEHAASMLDNDGVLVAVLPSSARQRLQLPERFECSWSETLDNQFPGASVSVVILTARTKA